jgi:hypothetical protein
MSQPPGSERTINEAVWQCARPNLCFVGNKELLKLTEVIVRDLCYTGLIHIDARLHGALGKIFLVEANPRF